ncbi:MAG: hypothetical protein H0X28_00155 [Solirubrobacterales bacterium]|nr:hypothetical protein [Solirubrobacterales bacterium]
MSSSSRTPTRRRAQNRLIPVALLGALTIAGCGGASALQPARAADLGGPVQERPDTAEASSGRRPAPVIHLPPHWSAHRQRALVIALHASGGTPAGFEGKSGWDTVADEHDFVLAYLGSGSPAWKDPSNVAYVSAEIKRIKARYNIDPRRVYVTGFSAGAYITYFVGCRLSATVAAIAPVSGAMASQRCRPTQPVSELTIIGTHDIIPLTGNARFPAPASVTARWRGLDHCSSAAPKVSRAGPVTKRIWTSCAGGAAVGFYVINGGTHTYPGASGLAPSSADAQYNASEDVWAFFAAHRSRG